MDQRRWEDDSSLVPRTKLCEGVWVWKECGCRGRMWVRLRVENVKNNRIR